MTSRSDTGELRESDRLHHLHAQTNPTQFGKEGPVMITRAKGVYLYTSDGHEVMDAMSGAWCTNIGYGDKRVINAAHEAMGELSYNVTFGGRTNPWVAALSGKMAAITPSQYQHFFYASTGSDAVESAIKMAWYYWHLRGQSRKRLIIGRDLGYHGNTIFATHLVGAEGWSAQYGFPLTDVVHRVVSPYWYRQGAGRSPEIFAKEAAAALEDKIRQLGPENVAAFIGEPIQATLGLIIPPPGYWPEVQRICKRYDVLFICDEIVTGMGKTGHRFGFQAFDCEPDLFTLAKGFSSGYFPISCVAVGSKVDEVLQQSDQRFTHGFTNCAHPVGAAVALANIEAIEQDGLIDKVRHDTGPYLANRLQDLAQLPCVGEVNSVGIIGTIEIDTGNPESGTRASHEADDVALGRKIGEIAWRKGLHARPIGTTLGMMFPMIVTREQIDTAVAIIKDSILEAVQK